MSDDEASKNNLYHQYLHIIEDTIQILVDDFDLMQDDEYEEPTEINAEEIIYDVIKVLEDCGDHEACLEMIVPVIGSLQKFEIKQQANLFLIQLFLHLIQTCLTGIKGEYILPKSIVKHIMEVVIDKLPHDEGLFIEKAFLLGALILNCQSDDIESMNYLCSNFMLPLFKLEIKDDVTEALTGCLTDVSGVFKGEFKSQNELTQTLIARVNHSPSERQDEALLNALGDIALSGGMTQDQISHIFQVVQQQLLQINGKKGFRMAVIQMHTCIFNSLGEQDHEFIVKVISYIFDLIDFVLRGIESDEDISKQHLKESLSLLLDIGVLYGKTELFQDVHRKILSQRTIPYLTRLRSLLENEDDIKTLLYFENVLQQIFNVDFHNL